MSHKPAYSIVHQIALLKQRGMLFRDAGIVTHFLENISYYHLKGYGWDTHNDNHTCPANTYFQDSMDRYSFDRHLRLILFDAIERIKISLRTKMIYHLSMTYGGLWYLDGNLFETTRLPSDPNITIHQNTIFKLKKEFNRSQEILIKDHRYRYPNQDADAWKVASMGTLSKLYKNLKHQLPEKSVIAKEMGLNFHNKLSGWLEAITYVRIENLTNPIGQWLTNTLTQVQTKKPFLIISCMVYLCTEVTPGHQIKNKILDVFNTNPDF